MSLLAFLKVSRFQRFQSFKVLAVEPLLLFETLKLCHFETLLLCE